MANEKRLIDANALCGSFEKAASKREFIDDMVFHLDYILDEITGAYEVDAVEVVHGRWLYDSGSDKYFCSACDENALECRRTYLDNSVLTEVMLSEYCPNCGAKMDGGNEDAER